MTEKNSKLVHQLNMAIGGEWRPTPAGAPVAGYTAGFPRFRSEAIVGVINDAAARAGFEEQAVSFAITGTDAAPVNTPDAPRQVVIPRELAMSAAFREQLNAEMKHVITHVVSQQLSYGVGQGMMYR